MTAERVITAAHGDQRERIVDVLVSRSNSKGYVSDLDVAGIARLTGIDVHDVAKHLWGLQKQDLIGFSTKRAGGGKTVPYRFRLKARLLGDTALTTSPPSRVERQLLAEMDGRTGAAPDAVPEGTERVLEAREPSRGIEVPLDDQGPTEAVPFDPESLSDNDYPMIAEVFYKQGKIKHAQAAVESLRAAGLDDLANMAAEEAGRLTDLELEIIRFVEVTFAS